jgi:hypothetical protein
MEKARKYFNITDRRDRENHFLRVMGGGGIYEYDFMINVYTSAPKFVDKYLAL